ncbi:MAG: flagellar brake protein [Aquabacterium sp.]|nr:flagellar brake protein [Aquabacterium sp.]
MTSSVEIQALLKQLLDARPMVTLSGPNGDSYTTLMWAAEDGRGLCFSAEDSDDRLDALLESGEIVAVAYLDSIKLQFDLDGVVHVKGGRHSALNAQYPTVLYRFQRRAAFRVQPLATKSPVAKFRHPAMPDMQLALRVLDVSLSGVALFLPDNVPMIAAGVKIGQCRLDLDDDTSMDVTVVIHHVTAIHPESKGVRLGCEFVGMDWSDRTLQHYINQTQKRRLALQADKR